MAGVPGGTVFLQPDRYMDVWLDLVLVSVVRDRAASMGLDVGEVDVRPHGCLWVVELLTGTDDLCFSEASDEGRYESLPYIVGPAELGKCGHEVVAMVEGDTEGTADGQFMAAHGRTPLRFRDWATAKWRWWGSR